MIARRLVSMAAATTPDLSPADTVAAATAGGFDGAGIWFDPTTWTDAVAREVRMRLDDTGLVALDIEPVIFGPNGDHGEALVDAALAIGARHVLMASRHPERSATVARFGALCDRAAPGGVTVVLEFLPIFTVGDLAAAVSIAREAGRPNGAVLVDNLHLARSGGSAADLAMVDRALLPYIQLSDAPVDPPAELYPEASDGRLLPGEGGLPLHDVLTAVPHVPVSVELRSAELRRRHPDAVERARVVWTASRTVMEGGAG